MAATTINKGCCATCVTRLVWHEEINGVLLYVWRGEPRAVGTTRTPEGMASPRFYCPEHSLPGVIS